MSTGKPSDQDASEAGSDSWTLSEAKARVADLFDAAANRGPQTIVGPDHEFRLVLTRSRRTPEAQELLLSGGRPTEPGRPSGRKE